MTTSKVKRTTLTAAFGTRISPSTLKSLRSFARKNKMSIGSVTNSALRIFIDDAKKIAKQTTGDEFKVQPYTADAQRVSGLVAKRAIVSKAYRKNA